MAQARRLYERVWNVLTAESTVAPTQHVIDTVAPTQRVIDIVSDHLVDVCDFAFLTDNMTNEHQVAATPLFLAYAGAAARELRANPEHVAARQTPIASVTQTAVSFLGVLYRFVELGTSTTTLDTCMRLLCAASAATWDLIMHTSVLEPDAFDTPTLCEKVRDARRQERMALRQHSLTLFTYMWLSCIAMAHVETHIIARVPSFHSAEHIGFVAYDRMVSWIRMVTDKRPDDELSNHLVTLHILIDSPPLIERIAFFFTGGTLLVHDVSESLQATNMHAMTTAGPMHDARAQQVLLRQRIAQYDLSTRENRSLFDATEAATRELRGISCYIVLEIVCSIVRSIGMQTAAERFGRLFQFDEARDRPIDGEMNFGDVFFAAAQDLEEQAHVREDTSAHARHGATVHADDDNNENEFHAVVRETREATFEATQLWTHIIMGTSNSIDVLDVFRHRRSAGTHSTVYAFPRILFIGGEIMFLSMRGAAYDVRSIDPIVILFYWLREMQSVLGDNPMLREFRDVIEGRQRVSRAITLLCD